MPPLVVALRLDGTILAGEARLSIRDVLVLLDAIDRTGSLRAAADELVLSYRAVWGRLLAYEAAFGRSLVSKTKGHGSGLTASGTQLLHLLQASAADVAGAVKAAETQLRAGLGELFEDCRPSRLALSHDPLVLEAALSFGSALEVAVMGSDAAVAQLRAGTVEGAGFHRGSEAGEEVSAEFDALGFGIVPLFRREQGLMLAPGNPLAIGSVRDLARPQVRFVNRQKGSGTRAWFDRMLAAAGIAPGSVQGYAAEEFTHRAVAAVVASGGADAGMGVRAEAERFGLDFVPLGRETYFLATRPDAQLDAFVDAVRNRVAELVGYDAA